MVLLLSSSVIHSVTTSHKTRRLELGPWTYCHNKMKRLPCLLILRKWKSWFVRSRRYHSRHTSSSSCSENFAKIYLTPESASTPPPPFFFSGYRNCRSTQTRWWYDIVGGRGCTIAINWNLMLRVGKYRVCRQTEMTLCVLNWKLADKPMELAQFRNKHSFPVLCRNATPRGH